ncbi:MAG: hypothetical protein Q9167_001317 [Letrouitia subvulpina]
MTTNLEKGITEEQPWAKEATTYLARLTPTAQEQLLVPLTALLKQWPKLQAHLSENDRGLWTDSFPWAWEMEQSPNDQGTITALTFQSVDEFFGYIQTRSAGHGKTPIILNEDYGTALKMSDSSYKVMTAPELIGLPGHKHNSVSARDHETVETQSFAMTHSIFPLEDIVMPAFDSHHYRPSSHALRLIKISQLNGALASDKCILICDSQDSRDLLHLSFVSSPYPGDGSSLSFSRCLQELVIDHMFRNLVLLENNLEKVVCLVASEFSIRIIWTDSLQQNYCGRVDPSYHMLNYVLYLSDHLKTQKRFLEYPTRRQPKFSDNRSADQWSIDFELNQEFLRNRITSIEEEVQHVQDTIKTQIESKNASRNFLFAILASLYLPFTLATGVFGMNIKEINNGTPNWKSVLEFGLPLALVTVAIPLSFGYGYRKVSVFLARHKKLSRRLFTWGSWVLFACIIILITLIASIFPTLLT